MKSKSLFDPIPQKAENPNYQGFTCQYQARFMVCSPGRVEGEGLDPLAKVKVSYCLE